MKIYGMMFDDELKYVGLSKSSVEKVVAHQQHVYRANNCAPKVWLGVMEPVPSPAPIQQKRDHKGRFVKSN